MAEKDEKVRLLSSVQRDSSSAKKQYYETATRNETVSKSEILHLTSGDVIGNDKAVCFKHFTWIDNRIHLTICTTICMHAVE